MSISNDTLQIIDSATGTALMFGLTVNLIAYNCPGAAFFSSIGMLFYATCLAVDLHQADPDTFCAKLCTGNHKLPSLFNRTIAQEPLIQVV